MWDRSFPFEEHPFDHERLPRSTAGHERNIMPVAAPPAASRAPGEMTVKDGDIEALRILIDQRRAGPFIDVKEARRQWQARTSAHQSRADIRSTGATDGRKNSGAAAPATTHDTRIHDRRAQIAEALAAFR